MTNAIALESTPFTPIFSAPEPYPSKADGTMMYPTPMAQLFFPDARAAVDFINAGMDSVYGVPLTLATFKRIDEGAYIGRQSEYNGSIKTDSDTGEVQLTITAPYNRSPETHARLREFVMQTIGIVVGNQEQQSA